MVKLFNGDCREVMQSEEYKNLTWGRSVVVVTDPPFNVGYHYDTYSDNMSDSEYYEMLSDIFSTNPFVIIHYPESIYSLAVKMNLIPSRVVSWVYNSNTKRQHRDIAFFGVSPDFSRVKQEYKNQSDKRIQERIMNGCLGADLYDWWEINQVKNISEEKTEHPCQMPQKVMDNIIGILPSGSLVVDPFMGSGTTGVSCKKNNVDFIGIELDDKYFQICKDRILGYSYEEKSQEKETIVPLW